MPCPRRQELPLSLLSTPAPADTSAHHFPLTKSIYPHPAEYKVFSPGKSQPILGALSLTQRQIQCELSIGPSKEELDQLPQHTFHLLSHVRDHWLITIWAISPEDYLSSLGAHDLKKSGEATTCYSAFWKVTRRQTPIAIRAFCGPQIPTASGLEKASGASSQFVFTVLIIHNDHAPKPAPGPSLPQQQRLPIFLSPTQTHSPHACS